MQTFGDYLIERYGAGWVVAPRMSARLRDRGYTAAITPARYQAEKDAWERATYGATLKHLRAAAPDMLAALWLLLETAELNQDDLEPETRRVIETATAAVAKAEGRA